jgi:cysteinyl-tRNA synthetase
MSKGGKVALKIYNTLTKQKELFKPIKDGQVGMYVCGITVYDLCHIGHARAFVVFDVIYRYLRYKGYEVTYVRNYTDVDDKIIDRANREGISCQEIAEYYIAQFNNDMEALGVLKPQIEPRVTQHIPEIIETIRQLIIRGYAYEVEGNVFYSVNKFPRYGRLSGKNIDDLIAGARIEVDERKENPLDFALWKASKPGEPAWDSPWGKGRPGWHIECSVMSMKYLGENFDIHGGGMDLIFPHHENEIAQSEAVTDKPFANYWIHNGFININQEKMSKSLGNVLTIQHLLAQYHPEILRCFLLSKHYRSPIDFNPARLAESQKIVGNIYSTLKNIQERIGNHKPANTYNEDDFVGEEKELFYTVARLKEKFIQAMDNDFNTAQALGYILQESKAINAYLERSEQKKMAEDKYLFLLDRARTELLMTGQILGILQEGPENYQLFIETEVYENLESFINALKRGITLQMKDTIDYEWLRSMIQEREEARKNKAWSRADEIRTDLLSKGLLLEDTPTGTRIRLKKVDSERVNKI